MHKKTTKKRCTSIGGQAVIEGVMMRGASSMATAVRDADGIIRVESKRLTPISKRSFLWRAPLIRGFLSLGSSFITGTKTLMRSAEVFGEGEPSKFEKWLAEKIRINVMSLIMTVGMFLGIVLAVGLFIFLPQLARQGLEAIFKTEFTVFPKNIIEGVFKIIIFVGYVSLVGLMKDIKRTYMYHGAEHKTIACFENGYEMTVENARKCSRQHDRCGTTFIFLVIIVSIICFAIIESVLSTIGLSKSKIKIYDLYRILIKIASFPLLAGISYEVLKALAKTKSKFFWIFKAPGLAIQKITTREPDDSMLEVAIKAFETVRVMDEDGTVPEQTFVVAKKCKDVLAEVKIALKESGIEDDADAEWIVSLVTKLKRSEVSSCEKVITPKYIEKIYRITNERKKGRPLWYVIGDADFYGFTVKVDERVLIPRPETENLVENVLKHIKKPCSVLDLCTGSGAIAIAIKKLKSDCQVTASDISSGAIELASENALSNNAEITFIKSDIFADIEERFDIIVSNPPYIKTSDIDALQKEVKDYEPIIALDGGEDGLRYYREIANQVKSHLNDGGMLFLEVGYDQAKAVSELLKGFSEVRIEKDLQGVERIVIAKL